MAKENLVVATAVLQCDQGSIPGSFLVPVRKCKSEGKNNGIITDNVLVVNIPTFGMCNLIAPFPGPCAPALAAPWTPGASKCKCEGTALIKDGDELVCSIGGTISVTNAGQTKVKGE